MSRSRLPVYLGATAVAGVGYYLYAAGGNPKIAEKKFEGGLTRSYSLDAQTTLLTPPSADAHKASAKIKSELPGRAKEAEAKASEMSSRVGSKFDSYVRLLWIAESIDVCLWCSDQCAGKLTCSFTG